jgi:hypothetical protein
VRDGGYGTLSTDFVSAPVSTSAVTSTGNDVITSIVTATYGVASIGSFTPDVVVGQVVNGVVLERFVGVTPSTTLTGTINTVGNGPYGRFAASVAVFKAQ